MDLVDYDEAVFDRIVEQFTDFAARLEVVDVTFIPISALNGDNVVRRSEHMPWYGGPALLHHLEHVHIASDRNLIDARFPVQWVIRPGTDEYHDYRGYAGQMAGGVLRAGDDVLVLPSGARSRIAAIDTFDGPVQEAFPPMSVTLRLEDDIDISRGDLICRPQNRPLLERDVDAMVCWMGEEPGQAGKRYLLKHTARQTRARVSGLVYRIDLEQLHRDRTADRLELNDIGRMTLRTATPLAFDPYSRNRMTGSFILIDETTNDTVAAGVLLGTHRGADAGDEGTLTRERRFERLGSRGATVWLSGVEDAHASTVAAVLEERLVDSGVPAYRLDGEALRSGVAAGLAEHGSSDGQRAGSLARVLADAGVVAIVSVGRPDADVAAAHEEVGLHLLEFELAPEDLDAAVDHVWTRLVDEGVVPGDR
jgi:bifunctional enzyme CysN/CysC